jgi:hypothetical protein
MIGERGKEAVMPLENNTEWMITLADKISQDITISFDGPPDILSLVQLLQPATNKANKLKGKSLIGGLA